MRSPALLNASIKQRIAADTKGDVWQKCTIPGCGRLTMRAEGVGLASFVCRYHWQLYARHGSHWHRTYSSADLKPYLATATKWIGAGGAKEAFVAHAIRALGLLLANAGQAEIVPRLKGMSAHKRARVAFARLRDAGTKPERVLAIYLAVNALINEDRGSHRVKEFRLVQVAKAVHRLASGYHRHWEVPLSDGRVAPLAMHVYPRSSGRVLRIIGTAIEEKCELAAADHLAEILELKVERFGPHPSTRPGWVPAWRREMLEAQTKKGSPSK